jgi:hypothetical protein
MKQSPPELDSLKIMVRSHTAISQAVCGLCGQPNGTLKTGTGLYDDGVHLGDICKLCLRGGKRGAATRTRSYAAELRKLAAMGPTGPSKGAEFRHADWLCRYADFLDELAGRLDVMNEWIPRPR